MIYDLIVVLLVYLVGYLRGRVVEYRFWRDNPLVISAQRAQIEHENDWDQ